jgi:hypothetical protein
MISLSKIATLALLTSSGSSTNLFELKDEATREANDIQKKVRDALALGGVRIGNFTQELPVAMSSP